MPQGASHIAPIMAQPSNAMPIGPETTQSVSVSAIRSGRTSLRIRQHHSMCVSRCRRWGGPDHRETRRSWWHAVARTMIRSYRHVNCLRGALPWHGRAAQPADRGPDGHDETDHEPEAKEPAEPADDHHERAATSVHHVHHGLDSPFQLADRESHWSMRLVTVSESARCNVPGSKANTNSVQPCTWRPSGRRTGSSVCANTRT